MSDAAREALENLLTFDPALRRSRFAWLRGYAESPALTNLIALLDRLEYVRRLGIDAARIKPIHPARLGRLLAEAAVMTMQHIADLEPVRRIAILIAQTADLEERLADATLAIFEKYIGSLFSKAQNRDERRFQATKRDVAKALLLFRRTIAALKQAQATREDGVAVVDREVGLKRLDDTLQIIGAVAGIADPDILVTAAERYSVLRRFSPRFLAAFRFELNVPQDPVLAAIEILKAMDRDGARALPKRPPASFLPAKWRRLCSRTAMRGSPIPPCSTSSRRKSWNRQRNPCAAKAGTGSRSCPSFHGRRPRALAVPRPRARRRPPSSSRKSRR